MHKLSEALIKRLQLDSVPREWEVVQLGRVASTQYGITTTATEAGSIPMLGMKDLDDGKVLLRDVMRIELSKHDIDAYRLVDGDILFNRTNSADLVGKTGIFRDGQDEPYVFASYLVRIAVDRKKADPDFICLFMNAHIAQCRLRALATPGVSQYNINPTNLRKDFLVPLPPLREQKRIGAIAAEWEAALESTSRLIEARSAYKKGLMQRLLKGKQQIPGSSDPWLECKLGEVFRERKEINRVNLPLLSVTGNRGVILHSESGRKDSSADDKSKYKRIVPGDIGYNTMRMWQGVSALSRLEGIISPAYTVCVPNEKIYGPFAAHLFKFPAVVHRFHRYSQGLVSDTLNLKFPNFAQVKVTLPPITAQKKIAAVLDAIDIEIESLDKLKDKFSEQKRGLMQKLLTGQIRMKESRNGRT